MFPSHDPGETLIHYNLVLMDVENLVGFVVLMVDVSRILVRLYVNQSQGRFSPQQFVKTTLSHIKLKGNLVRYQLLRYHLIQRDLTTQNQLKKVDSVLISVNQQFPVVLMVFVLVTT